MSRLALPAVCAALLAGCGGGGDAVAHVGGDTITKTQLDALVDQARREGKDFPAEGTSAFRQLRNHLLGTLVYRTELEQAARRLGVTVDQDELSKRLAAGSASRESIEAQLLLEGIATRVARVPAGRNARDMGESRERKLARFVDRLRRETSVRYEPGYGPSS
jgi:hypothetical protein